MDFEKLQTAFSNALANGKTARKVSIAYSEWIGKNDYRYSLDGKWYDGNDISKLYSFELIRLTSEELFSKFISQYKP